MKLVIDIPEEIIITCMQHNMPVDCEMFANKMVLDIANGTPLPKRHGRLIDADALLSKAKFLYKGYEIALTNTIGNAPTIIEADKGTKHEQ